ncbi:hypothetical protein MSAS_35570 [Mycobacterium saskatchewanense]|uniref:Uncharacterized protein n=1 Tax=Mycobacterium saskatchewanense TaxID=220927 RepID=A0AAJ3TTC1_9MYCO|nr:hypothetical protein [Mycobacterium saskatchewanense]ORW67688.1 hypothetical protein AWC23_22430 [Mycobacterium saskatchewanense]BBX64383.1 hypothetical protein MSAS_35570 [Mycobacterium saskatchewanense]
MTTQHHRIAKVLAGAAAAVGLGLAAAAPAAAQPNSVDNGPNPFGGFSCTCQRAAPADGPTLQQQIAAGIRQGHVAAVPGLPAPAGLPAA